VNCDVNLNYPERGSWERQLVEGMIRPIRVVVPDEKVDIVFAPDSG
jgi:hypothetical protein